MSLESLCITCGTTFIVMPDEKQFLERMDLPCPPRNCPKCRRQRRLAFRNERRLYYRKCDFSGKTIVALYPRDTKKKEITTYDQKVWWDDQHWDQMEEGKDFDFSRSFFEQFAELKKVVPRPSLHNTNAENAMFGNHCVSNKDCFFNVGSDLCEGCFFTYWAIRCNDCFDITIGYDSELCYDCTDIRNGFNCYRVDNSEIMIDCQYCYNCKSCQNCFGCVGLRHKNYHLLNTKYSAEEYRERVKYLYENPERMEEFMVRYNALKNSAIYCVDKNIQCQNTIGDRLFRCKDSKYSFDLEKCDGVNYSTFGFEGIASQDIDFFGRSELLYEGFAAFGQYNCISTILCHYSYDVSYSEYCISSNHLFGCISLHHKEYCVLNKQYSKEEYGILVPKIINHMKKTGEWGEFFPMNMSPFPYNITVAQRYYPLTKEQIENNGLAYEEVEGDLEGYKGPFTDLPKDYENVDDSIVGKPLKCEETGRPYQIMAKELKFLRDRGIPLPRVHPDVRNQIRIERRNHQSLWRHICPVCKRQCYGSISPNENKCVYCRPCYEKEIVS